MFSQITIVCNDIKNKATINYATYINVAMGRHRKVKGIYLFIIESPKTIAWNKRNSYIAFFFVVSSVLYIRVIVTPHHWNEARPVSRTVCSERT